MTFASHIQGVVSAVPIGGVRHLLVSATVVNKVAIDPQATERYKALCKAESRFNLG
jgi:hypothetical protein